MKFYFFVLLLLFRVNRIFKTSSGHVDKSLTFYFKHFIKNDHYVDKSNISDFCFSDFYVHQ